MIRHVVLFRFAETVDDEEIARILDGFSELVEIVPGAVGVTGGANVSPEGLDRGYMHGFVMDFETARSRDDYLAHPAHVSFANGTVIPALEHGLDSVAVFDYEY